METVAKRDAANEHLTLDYDQREIETIILKDAEGLRALRERLFENIQSCFEDEVRTGRDCGEYDVWQRWSALGDYMDAIGVSEEDDWNDRATVGVLWREGQQAIARLAVAATASHRVISSRPPTRNWR